MVMVIADHNGLLVNWWTVTSCWSYGGTEWACMCGRTALFRYLNIAYVILNEAFSVLKNKSCLFGFVPRRMFSVKVRYMGGELSKREGVLFHW